MLAAVPLFLLFHVNKSGSQVFACAKLVVLDLHTVIFRTCIPPMPIHVAKSCSSRRVSAEFGNVHLLLQLQLRIHVVVNHVSLSTETNADIAAFINQEGLTWCETLKWHQRLGLGSRREVRRLVECVWEVESLLVDVPAHLQEWSPGWAPFHTYIADVFEA